MQRLIDALSGLFLAQRDRWILWLPVPVGLGILWYFSLKAEPPAFSGLFALVFIGMVAGAFSRNRAALLLLLPLLLVTLGFAAAQWRTWSVAAPAIARKTYPVTIEGRIAAVDPLPRSYRIVLEDFKVTGGKIWQKELPHRVRVKLKANDTAEPNAGDIVSVKAVLLPLSPPLLPGAFDFQRYAFFQRLGGTGYAIGELKTVKAAEGGYFFQHLRRAIRERIEAQASTKDNAALMTAFMVGDSKRISEETWETARESGIAHLIAISGSHFILIAGLPFFLVRALLAAVPFIALRWPVKKIAAGAAVAFSLFYMLLIGAPIPAQRAMLSVAVVMFAIMLDRDPFTLRVAAFAALVILLLKPESLLGASFQLSFSAIIALIASYEMTREWWKERFRDESIIQRYSSFMLGCAMSTLVASVATAAYALYHFARMPLLAGLAANMVAVPVTSFGTFPMGLFACLLMPFGLEKYPLWLTEKSIDLVMAAARAVVDWPYAAWQGGAVPFWFLGPVTLGGLWICFWKGRLRLAGVAPIAVAAALLPFSPKPDVLVAQSAALFAVRGADGALWMSTVRREKFVRNEWLALHGGEERFRLWPEAGAAGDFLACTDEACAYRMKGHTVMFLRKPGALAAGCDGADLVYSELGLKAESCRDRTILRDRWDIRRHGAQAVYLDEGQPPRIETVLGQRGIRPWTGKPWEPRRDKGRVDPPQ